LARFRQLKHACPDRKIDPRRDEIDVIALDRHVLRRFQHLHRSVAGQKTDHHAFVSRIEMLNQDEGHAGVGRKRVEELVESLQSPGRSAETDHHEVVGPGRSLSLSRTASARPQPGLLSPTWAGFNRHGFWPSTLPCIAVRWGESGQQLELLSLGPQQLLEVLAEDPVELLMQLDDLDL